MSECSPGYILEGKGGNMAISIPKALEILDLNLLEAGPKMPADVKASVALGCQALRTIQTYRRVYFPMIQDLLIGEEAEPQNGKQGVNLYREEK